MAPVDSPLVADFMALLDPVNALADAAPGFVWRLQTEEGNATSLHIYGDDTLNVNMSVWESKEALWDFVYSGDHLAVMRRRREWFKRIEQFMCLWWVPAGHLPDIPEAEERLDAPSRARPDAARVHLQGGTSRRPAMRPSRVISLVIFDCDGVLVDSEPISCRVMAEALTAEGLPYTTEDVHARLHGDGLGRLARDDRGASSAARRRAGLHRATSARARDAALLEEVEPIAGVREAIDAVEAGSRRASPRAAPHEKIRAHARQRRASCELFEGAIFSATDVERGKPAPDLFLHAARDDGPRARSTASSSRTRPSGSRRRGRRE